MLILLHHYVWGLNEAQAERVRRKVFDLTRGEGNYSLG